MVSIRPWEQVLNNNCTIGKSLSLVGVKSTKPQFIPIQMMLQKLTNGERVEWEIEIIPWNVRTNDFYFMNNE